MPTPPNDPASGAHAAAAPDVMTGRITRGSLRTLLEYFRRIEAEGRLVLERGPERAQVYLEEGEVVHGLWRERTGREALEGLLEWSDGTFTFEPDLLSPVRTVTPELEAVRDDRRAAADAVLFDAPAVAPQRPAVDAAPAASSGGGSAAAIPEAVLAEVTRLARQACGPIADVLMEDAAFDLGYDAPEEVPATKANRFVAAVADSIDDDTRCRQFLEAAMAFLRRSGIGER